MSRPKLNMPLKEQNSPRSQWISNVSLLKNQLKDGEMIENGNPSNTKLSWTEVEAKLSKRMRGPSTSVPVSPTGNLNLISHPRHSTTPKLSNSLPTTPKRPTLQIPTSPKSKELLKQVQSGAVPIPTLPEKRRHPASVRKERDFDTSSNIAEKPASDKTQQKYVTNIHNIEKESKVIKPNNVLTNDMNETNVARKNSLPSRQEKQLNLVENHKPSKVIENDERRTAELHKIDNGENKNELKTSTERELHSNTKIITKIDINNAGKANVPTLASDRSQHGADTIASIQAIGSYMTTPSRRVPRPNRESSKTKGSLSWLRKALKPNDSSGISKRTVTSTPKIVLRTSSSGASISKVDSKIGQSTSMTIEKYFRPTTPLQNGLWVSEVLRAIRKAQQDEQQNKSNPTKTTIVDHLPTVENGEGQQDQNNGEVHKLEDQYYQKNKDIGVYVDYSTFDDGDSVTSVELLFKWLTCQDLNDVDNKLRGDNSMEPPGTVIATESNISDELSIDLDAKPTRRTFFSR